MPPGWAIGLPLSCAHDDQPADPGAIAQLGAQLDAWNDEDGGRAVLLVGPAWSDHAIWDPLLAALEPARPAGANFDLRRGADPAEVTAIAFHYTADLDDDGSGDVAGLAAQITSAVDRIVALTGRAQVILVAHSTPGTAARLAAARRRDAVKAVATLGTPHDGAAPDPLAVPGLADAVRAARAMGAVADPLGAVLARLDAALDGAAGAWTASACRPVPPGTPEGAAGFALGSALGGDLMAGLAAALGARVSAAAADPNRKAPTHLGLGARLALDLAPAPGEPEVDAGVRIDAGRIRLVADTPEPPRKPQAVHAHVATARPGGWLVGQAAGAGPRIRAATLDVEIAPAPGGGIAVIPELTLTDVVLGAARRDLRLGDDGLGPALSLLAEAFGDRLDPDVLAGLVSNPVATLTAQRDAMLDAVETALGGALARTLAGIPLELTLDRATWTLGLRTTADLALGEGVTLALDGGFSLATMRPTLQAALMVGAVTLTQRDGTLTLAADPWLPPLTVVPAPSPATLRDRLLPVLPRVALSAALSAGLGELLGVTGTLGALDSLLADPGARLRQLTSSDIQAILRAAAQAAGVDDTNGLHLPGDFVLRASGADPLRLDLSGTVDLGGGAPSLAVDLWLDVGADRRVSPGGSVTIDAALATGNWGRLATTFSVDASGVGLVLAPQGAAPITLLPRFSGFADLAAAATTSLLPHVLQAIVDELRPAVGPPDGVLGAVLAIATDLGIYADDAQGFEAPGRIAALAAMLQPGWLDNQLANPVGLATLATGLFGPPPLLQMPIGGAPVAAGDRISWTAPLPAPATGDVTVTVALGSPAVSVVVTGLAVGPLVIETAGVGYDGDFVLEVAVALDPGGDLAFLRPAAELGVDGDRVRAALLPLGSANRADVEVVLAPAPALTFDPEGALALLLEWGVPLVGKLALRAAGSAIDEALWTIGASRGPTARDVLEGAGLLQPGAPGGDPLLALPLPALDRIALGAVQALASGIEVPVTDTLRLAIVDDGAGRKGIRLVGHQELDAGDMTVSLSFGETIDPEWLEDPAAGVTLWLLETHPAALPTLAPGIQAIGLGALLGKKDDAPLIDTALAIGKAGGMVFFALDLVDPTGAPHVAVSQLGGALDLRDAQINIASSDGDGFIQKLLPPELQAPFQLAVSARAGRGLELFGGIGSTPGMIELDLPARPGPGRDRPDRRGVRQRRARRLLVRADRGDLGRRPPGPRGRCGAAGRACASTWARGRRASASRRPTRSGLSIDTPTRHASAASCSSTRSTAATSAPSRSRSRRSSRSSLSGSSPRRTRTARPASRCCC